MERPRKALGRGPPELSLEENGQLLFRRQSVEHFGRREIGGGGSPWDTGATPGREKKHSRQREYSERPRTQRTHSSEIPSSSNFPTSSNFYTASQGVSQTRNTKVKVKQRSGSG